MKKLIKKEIEETKEGLKKLYNINLEEIIVDGKFFTIETSDFELLKKVFRYGIEYKKFNLIPNGHNKISFIKYEDDILKIRTL